MTNYTEVNAWTAMKCGVNPDIYGCHIDEDYSDYSMAKEWSIERADCREVIRERFKISTVPDMYDNWISRPDSDDCLYGVRETIAEAEITCIVALWEKEK